MAPIKSPRWCLGGEYSAIILKSRRDAPVKQIQEALGSYISEMSGLKEPPMLWLSPVAALTAAAFGQIFPTYDLPLRDSRAAAYGDPVWPSGAD